MADEKRKTDVGVAQHNDDAGANPNRTITNETLHDGHGNSGATTKGKAGNVKLDAKTAEAAALSAKLENPLAGRTHAELEADADAFADKYGFADQKPIMRRAAVVAQDPLAFEELPMLSEEEKQALRNERDHRWSQTTELYKMVILCSVAAAVQGMDETVINGANLFWQKQFGLAPNSETDTSNLLYPLDTADWLSGLTVGAPYLCCAILGCWLTDPLNNWLGRRGTIFLTATISALAVIWSAVTNSWQHLFVSRLVLGLGIGPKSSTVPVYAAECSPAPIRGALVMQWQTWTAFGIMLGTVSSLVFYHVNDTSSITGLNWRLMLGSACLPAFVVMAQVYTCPESPRWLIKKGRYGEAYKSLLRLRKSEIQAARDLYYMHTLLIAENEVVRGRNRFIELFSIPRNRRAALASGIVMFGQQFCGVNAIVYYSSTVLVNSGLSEISALLGSFGFGLINWIFAVPAILTIDRFGRRQLLLVTFPLMSLFLLITGLSFLSPSRNGRIGGVLFGIYAYDMVYSPGEGPVPFTYSAEAFPLYLRELGMSLATAITWGFNFIVGLTFPRLLRAFGDIGAFCWYAAWCAILFFLILLFLPETKALTLEELDMVFSVSTRTHALYQLRNGPRLLMQSLGKKDMDIPELYDIKGLSQDLGPGAKRQSARAMADHSEKA